MAQKARVALCLSGESFILLITLLLHTASVFAQSENNSAPIQISEEPGDTSFTNLPTNSYWEGLEFDPSIYNSPYKISLFNPQNGENKQRLWSQTKSMFAYGFGVAGALALMPEDITGWDDDSAEPFKKWADNVSQGPVWDRDVWYINYIGHPYFGGVYYQSARKSGYRQWDAFVYSFMMSTFYWEYGIEAFAEIPALQDLVVTPVLGWIYGEWAFNKEQEILMRGGTVGGSRLWGSTSLFLLDPVDSIGSWVNNKFGRTVITAGTGYFSYADPPYAAPGNTTGEKQLTLGVRYTLGGGNEPAYYKRYQAMSDDPVDTGIVGLSLGAGHISLDDDWNFGDGSFPEWTLGLYFSPRFSMRLKYGRTKLDDMSTGGSVYYENYSVDTQYYFNSDADTRPYLSAGVGEEMFDKDRDRKYVLWNLGIGIHHKINNNWALQADWGNFYSPSKHTYESSINARILYRFGRGEDIKRRE